MPDSYEIREVDDAQDWDEFVCQAVGGSVFSTWGWLDCARQAAGGAVRCHGCYRNGRLVAGVSGLARTRAGVRRLTTPVLTPHGGLLCSPVPSKGPAKVEAEWNRAAALLADQLEGAYDHVQLCFAPAIRDVRPFVWAGWDARVRYTCRMRLGDPDALWERLGLHTRTTIRRAEESGFQVGPAHDLALFRRQLETIYAGQGERPPEDPSLVQKLLELATSAGLAYTLQVASPNGTVAAMVAFARGLDTVYAWQPGADPAFDCTGALSLLYWRVLEEAAVGNFDFAGANAPPAALFERGFGGDLVPYLVVEHGGGWPMRAAAAGRRVLRQWRGG